MAREEKVRMERPLMMDCAMDTRTHGLRWVSWPSCAASPGPPARVGSMEQEGVAGLTGCVAGVCALTREHRGPSYSLKYKAIVFRL